MSKQRHDLEVETRETGKRSSRALRDERKVPAVVYGTSTKANVFIDERVVIKYTSQAYENALFSLKSKDNSKLNNVIVLVKDFSVHPVTRRPQHVDLFALDLSKTVRVSVEVKLEGKPIGIADGGLLNVVNRQVEIECLPTEIPESFTLDISNMGVGDSLHVSDLQVPEGTKVISGPELTIAVLSLYVEEAAAAPTAAAAAPAAGAAAPAAGAPAAAGAKAGDAKAAAPAAGAKAAPAKK